MTKDEVIARYLGIPYKNKGRTLDGLDCWGLAVLIYRDLGFELFDIEEYEVGWSRKGKNYFIENYYEKWTKVEVPNIFDIVLFHNGEGVCNHVGIVISKDEFIHCPRAGVVIGKTADINWVTKIEGFYKYNDRY